MPIMHAMRFINAYLKEMDAAAWNEGSSKGPAKSLQLTLRRYCIQPNILCYCKHISSYYVPSYHIYMQGLIFETLTLKVRTKCTLHHRYSLPTRTFEGNNITKINICIYSSYILSIYLIFCISTGCDIFLSIKLIQRTYKYPCI